MFYPLQGCIFINEDGEERVAFVAGPLKSGRIASTGNLLDLYVLSEGGICRRATVQRDDEGKVRRSWRPIPKETANG